MEGWRALQGCLTTDCPAAGRRRLDGRVHRRGVPTSLDAAACRRALDPDRTRNAPDEEDRCAPTPVPRLATRRQDRHEPRSTQCVRSSDAHATRRESTEPEAGLSHRSAAVLAAAHLRAEDEALEAALECDGRSLLEVSERAHLPSRSSLQSSGTPRLSRSRTRLARVTNTLSALVLVDVGLDVTRTGVPDFGLEAIQESARPLH